MERKRYLKICSNKTLVVLLIISGTILTYLCNIPHVNERKENDLGGTTAPILVSIGIKWRDSVYRTILNEYDLASILTTNGRDTVSREKFIKDFTEKSYNDTLLVDSLWFMRLKKHIVTSQSRIDSIYESRGIKGLFVAYFENGWFVPYCKDGLLTRPEQRYVIELLQHHGYFMIEDCESGCLYVTKF